MDDRQQRGLFKVVHAYESAVATWLYRVALKCALTWSRKERRHRDRTEPLEGNESAPKETLRRQDRRLSWLYEQIERLARRAETGHVTR